MAHKKFVVGDKIKRLVGNGGGTFVGYIGVISQIIGHNNGALGYKFEDGATGWEWFDIRKNEWELVEEEVLPIAQKPVAFLFFEEGPVGVTNPRKGLIPFTARQQLGFEFFHSLEEAQEHCVRLRERIGKQNIFAYVRVE